MEKFILAVLVNVVMYGGCLFGIIKGADLVTILLVTWFLSTMLTFTVMHLG